MTPLEAATSTDRLSTAAMLRKVREHVSRVRRRANGLRCARLIGILLTSICAALIVSMTLDSRLTLPWVVRAGVLIASLSLALCCVRRHQARVLSDDDAALMIERRMLLTDNPIISAIQLERATDSPLLRGVAVQALKAIEPFEPRVVAPIHEVSRWAIVALVLVVSMLVWWLAGPIWGRAMLARALLVPGVSIPTETQLELIGDAPMRFGAGDDVIVRFRASGVLPPLGSAGVRYERGATETRPVRPEPNDPSTYSLSVEVPAESFEVTLRLHDATLGPIQVQRVVPPEVSRINATVHWPDYARRDPEIRTLQGLRVLAGSMLDLTVATTSPAMGVIEQLDPTGTELKLISVDDDPLLLTLAVPLEFGPGNTRWRATVSLRDEHGFRSTLPADIEVMIEPDAKPTVRWIVPTPTRLLVTPRARPRFEVVASDDTGMEQIVLRTMIRRAGTYPSIEGDGVLMTAYSKPDFTGRSEAWRVDQIDRNFAGDAPAPGFPLDLFSVRWEGLLLVPESGRYVFRAEVDDHVRLWIDGTVVFATSIGQNLVSRPITLESGLRRIRVDLREDYGEAFLRLAWRKEGGRFEVIPRPALFVDEASVGRARDRVAARDTLWTHADAAPVMYVEKAFRLDLPSMDLRPGDVVDCWVEAHDANNLTGPGLARSTLVSVEIGTDAQVRDALLARLGDYRAEIDRIEQRQTRARSHTDEGDSP